MKETKTPGPLSETPRRSNSLSNDEETIRRFVRQVVEVSGLSPSALARKAKLSDTTLTRFLRGSSGHTISARSISVLCRAAGVKDPFATSANAVASVKIPLRGFVKAIGTVHFMAEDQSDLAVELAELPPGIDPRDVFTLINRDDTNPPFTAGWLFIVERLQRSPEELIGKVCVVTLTDGETYVRELQRGSLPGRYNLHTAAGRPMFDRNVARAHKISVFVQP